jgi:hypothetical protein
MAFIVIFAAGIFLMASTLEPAPVTSFGIGDVFWVFGALILAILVAKVFVGRGPGHQDY